LIDFWCFNATLSNITAISWRPVLVVEEAGVPGVPNNSYKPITNTAWGRARLCNLQKGCTRLAAASDKAYQLLVHGRWFSPGTPASSTTKTGRHDIAVILLRVALKHQKSINQSNQNSKPIHVKTQNTFWFI
jgi:hypothetical protein